MSFKKALVLLTRTSASAFDSALDDTLDIAFDSTLLLLWLALPQNVLLLSLMALLLVLLIVLFIVRYYSFG